MPKHNTTLCYGVGFHSWHCLCGVFFIQISYILLYSLYHVIAVLGLFLPSLIVCAM